MDEIVQEYPSLELADVYSVISYLLGNEAVVRDYVARRVEAAQALRIEIQRGSVSGSIRQRLLARRRPASGA